MFLFHMILQKNTCFFGASSNFEQAALKTDQELANYFGLPFHQFLLPTPAGFNLFGDLFPLLSQLLIKPVILLPQEEHDCVGIQVTLHLLIEAQQRCRYSSDKLILYHHEGDLWLYMQIRKVYTSS